MDLQNGQAVPAKRRRYNDGFKHDAVRLVVEEGYSFKTASEAVGNGLSALTVSSTSTLLWLPSLLITSYLAQGYLRRETQGCRPGSPERRQSPGSTRTRGQV